MTARTYVELFEPQIVLSVRPVLGGYTVRDQNGQAYVIAPASLGFAIRFMYAMHRKNDATIDYASVEQATWQSSGRGPQAAPDPVSSARPHAEPAPLPGYSVAVPSNVFPLFVSPTSPASSPGATERRAP